MSVGKRYAVITGVTRYDDDQVAPLQYTKNDAARLADVLVRCCGFDKKRVYLLVDKSPEDPADLHIAGAPTRASVLQKVQHVVKAAQEDDLLFFFFAGHGAEVSKNPYLLTSDTQMDVLQRTAVDVREINEMLEATAARCIIRVFDACRSPFGEARGAALGRMTDGLQNAILKTATGWASFSSCSSGEVAYESGEFGQGVFSYYLCEGLEGKAANDSGEITFERLADYVKTSVGNWSDEQSRKQTPHTQSDLSGVLTLGSVELRPAVISGSIPHPLQALRSGIDLHLAQTPEDARNLTFTDVAETNKLMDHVTHCIQKLIKEPLHSSLSVTIEEPSPLNQCGQPWSEYNNDMHKNRVVSEHRNTTDAIQIEFTSNEVVIPSTVLTIAITQFSFFHWIWYCHECPSQQLQGSFSPNPNVKSGFFTLKPKASINEATIEDSFAELLNRVSEDILDWAKQLGGYVNSRLEPLRSLGPIVE